MSAKHVLRWVGAEAFIAKPIRPAPAVLRFDGDDFMERMLGLLEATPQQLPELVAKHETWNGLGAPTPEPPSLVAPATSRAARALKRGTALLGFRRDARPPASPTPGSKATPTLKLFQPIHQRYYLAAAHLVCELPGLPPRITSAGDKSGFVLRRLMKTASGTVVELGFVKENGTPGRWTPIPAPDTQLAPNEEWLPVFPMSYAPPTGPRRALLAGLIPVARHDEYRFARRVTEAEAKGNAGPGWGRADELKALAQMKIIAPWQGMIESAYAGGAAATAEDGGLASNTTDAIISLNNQLVESSWRLLQDMREFFDAHLPDVADAIADDKLPTRGAAAIELVTALRTATAPANGNVASDAVLALPQAVHLADALCRIAGVTSTLDKIETHFPKVLNSAPEWPNFAFPLVLAQATDALNAVAEPDPHHPGQTRAKGRLIEGAFRAFAAGAAVGAPPAPANLTNDALRRDYYRDWAQDADNLALDAPPPPGQPYANAPPSLFKLLAAAVEEAVKNGVSGAANPQATSAARLARDLAQSLAADSGPPRFVLRFVHKRCDCGPLHPLVISAPSEVFELAGFFDSDAPLRPIRIALPFDTTPGGLRKFGKNSAFIMSDLLCGQMKRVRRLSFGRLVRSVLPWPFHKDLDVSSMAPCSDDKGVNFGVICSLSIPIITIVAFVLLIVIAILLDLIFHWLPFLIACFPVPGLKGKRSDG